jgi:exopolysaccharide biosynthesis polyprenyl glycosylphosphotransferase
MLKRFKQLTILGGDLLNLHLALFLTIAARYPRTAWSETWDNHWPRFIIIFGCWIFCLYINNLYDLNLTAAGRRFYASSLNASTLSIFLSLIYFYLNNQTDITPKTNLLIFIVIFLILFWLWRHIYAKIMPSLIAKENLGIVGHGPLTDKLIAAINDYPGCNYQVSLIIDNLEQTADLPALIKNKNIQTLVVSQDFDSKNLKEILFSSSTYNLSFFDYPDFYELVTGKIPVEAIGPSWFLEHIRPDDKRAYILIKRAFDLILALLVLVVSLPFWPLIALGIKLSSRGPVFFTQARLGQHGQTFQIIKFRTMRTENNQQHPTEISDKRITWFGNWLRKTRLDEIPQVLNILKDDMSFIGPRPERPEIVTELEQRIPFYKTRLLIKPGLTGWDQISGKYHSSSAEDSWEKLQYDLFYLKQRSLYLDVIIALKTLATMLSQVGR